MRFLPSISCLLIAPFLATSLGCGSGKKGAVVAGDVTLDGQPLAEGAIKFIPLPGTSGAVTGTDIKGGKYKLRAETGAAIGPNRVEITAMRKSGKMMQAPMGPPGTMVEMEVSAVAARFNTASTLTYDVKPGENKADFAVESK